LDSYQGLTTILLDERTAIAMTVIRAVESADRARKKGRFCRA
jgi:hypothetical protein